MLRKLIPKYIDSQVKNNKVKKIDKKLQAIDNIRQNLLSGVSGAQKQLDSVNADTARKRERLVSRIIDAQNKLKDLQEILNSFKGL